MRPLVRAAGLALVIGAALSSSACVTQTEPEPEPSPTASPLFASDEEALAAAEEAYRAYLDVENVVLAEGGVDGERIYPVAIGEARQAAVDGFAAFQENGYRAVGDAGYDSVELQSYDPEATIGTVVVYMCMDLAHQDVLDAENRSVVNPDGVARYPIEVSFDESDLAHELVMSSRDPWTGTNKC